MSSAALRAMRPATWAILAGCVLAVAMIKPVQDRVFARFEIRGPDADVLWLSKPEVVRRAALGYESVLADIYWMRAIQYYGRRDEAERRPVRYKNLAALIDIATTLDPGMLDVYRGGCWFLSEPEPLGAGQPEEAVRLLDKGIRSHPLDWRLYFDKGFVYYWSLRDYRKAGDVWLEASSLGTAPHWMAALAAKALSEGGDLDTARRLWQDQLEQSNRTEVRDNARNHLHSLQVAETIWTLEFFLGKFRARFGRFPERLEDLVTARYLQYVPADPSEAPYAYEPSSGQVSLGPESRVRLLSVPPGFKESLMKKLAQRYGLP